MSTQKGSPMVSQLAYIMCDMLDMVNSKNTDLIDYCKTLNGYSDPLTVKIQYAVIETFYKQDKLHLLTKSLFDKLWQPTLERMRSSMLVS